MASKITRLPGAKLSPQVLLAKALEDAIAGEFDKVMVVSWNADGSGVSWSAMTLGDMAFGCKLLEHATMRELER